jgi:integrase/recombinase XerD
VTLPEYRIGRLPANFGKKFPPEILTPEEIHRLIDAIGSRRKAPSKAVVRDRALVVFLYRTGLRISEALALRERDINLSTGVIKVRRGTKGKPRTVALDEAGLAYLRPWIEIRSTLGVDANASLFCVTDGPTAGQPLGGSWVRTMLPAAAKRAGITKRVNPHNFRHTFAVELYRDREHFGINEIRQLLGHVSLDTTAKYLEALEPVEMIEGVRGRKSPWGVA